MDEFKSPTSSNIAGARYDKETKKLEVDFHRSGTYVYDKFPPKMWSQFKSALSKGTFLSTHIIKDRAKPRFKGVKKEKTNDTTHITN